MKFLLKILLDNVESYVFALTYNPVVTRNYGVKEIRPLTLERYQGILIFNR